VENVNDKFVLVDATGIDSLTDDSPTEDFIYEYIVKKCDMFLFMVKDKLERNYEVLMRVLKQCKDKKVIVIYNSMEIE